MLRRLDDDDDQPVPRPDGIALVARIVAAVLAALVPIFLLLKQVSAAGVSANGWDTYQAVDVVVLIFAILTVAILAVSYASGNPALPAAAVGLAFAMFGLVMALPIEAIASSDSAKLEIGAVLAILSAFGSGLASLVVAASDAAQARLR